MSSITLPTSLTIQSVTADHKHLIERLSGIEGPVEIDAGSVEEIDTAGMQLLLAVISELDSRSVKTQWVAPTQVLLQTAATLGMSNALSLPQAA